MTATITTIGNLTSDPELRFSQNGLAVASFTVASTEKVFDKATNEFKDGKTLFMRCTAWRELGEHVAASLTKGTRVIAVGKIATNEFQTKEGEKRSSIEMTVDSIGPDLKYATAQVTKTGARGQQQPASTSGADGRATSAPGNANASGGGFYEAPGAEETPF